MRAEIGQFQKTGWRRHAALGCVFVLLAFLAGPDRRPVMVGRELPVPIFSPHLDEPKTSPEADERPRSIVLGTPTVIQESPVHIAAYINNDEWRLTGGHFNLDAFLKNLGIDDPFQIVASDSLTATAQNRDLDGKPGSETILTVTQNQANRLFLVFRPLRKGWKFLGCIPSSQFYSPAGFRIRHIAGKTVFSTQDLGGRGSGYFCQFENWFVLAADRIHLAFRYLESGHQSFYSHKTCPGAMWEMETSPGTADQNQMRLDVSFVLSATSEEKDHHRPLRLSRRFFYYWDESLHRFELDEPGSGATCDDFNRGCNFAEESAVWDSGAFLRVFDQSLKIIANGRDQKARTDLRNFLSAPLFDNHERAALFELLDRKR
jgi:hypothetical protein